MKSNFLKTISILAFIIPGLLLGSCFYKSYALSKITVENGAIPPDFGKDETILLCIVYDRRSYDRYLKKHVTKRYHGKYEFVERGNVHEKYANASKYRYKFYHEKTYRNYPNHGTTGSYSFYIEDRLKNATYYCPISSSFFGKTIKAYMINLEKKRKKHL